MYWFHHNHGGRFQVKRCAANVSSRMRRFILTARKPRTGATTKEGHPMNGYPSLCLQQIPEQALQIVDRREAVHHHPAVGLQPDFQPVRDISEPILQMQITIR